MRLLQVVAMAAVLAAAGVGSGDERGDRVAELEQGISAGDAASLPPLLNELAGLVWRRDPARAIDLTTRSLEIAGEDGDPGIRAAAHETMGRALLWSDASRESYEQMHRARQLYEQIGDTVMIARCLGFEGMALSNLGQLWPAIEVVEQALELFRELDDRRGTAAATNNLGVYHEGVGEYEQALRFNLESLEIERELGRKVGIANNLNSIGNIYSRLENPAKGRDYYLEALELFTDIGNDYGVAQVLNNLGNTYEDLDQDEQALEYFQRALAAAETLGSLEAQTAPLSNMGIVYKKQGRYEDALASYRRAAGIERQLEADGRLAVSFQNIGETLLLMGRLDEAEHKLREAESIELAAGTKAGLDGTYGNLAELYRRRGDYRQAFEALKRHGEVREAQVNEEKSRAIAELEQRYEAERRREEIDLLSKDNELLRKDGEIRQLALSRTRLAAALLALSIALLLGGAVLLLRRYRSLLAFWKRRTFVGPYRLDEEISEGGMGVVYRAISVAEPSRTVALKVIREELSGDEVQRRRFINEGRIIDSIDHPNIVKVFERGEHNHRLYIAMEYLEGRTLAELISDSARRGVMIPQETCVALMRQLVDAVATIHARGIVHRDIKPTNIVVRNPEGNPSATLLDFGVARLDTMTTLTAVGEIVGTMSYLAPEQIQHRDPGPASDVFSLGVMFYEMVTLERPFLADDPVALLRSVLDTEPLPPRRYRENLDDELGELVMAMLAKDPSRRPSSEELIHRLGLVARAVER